LNGDRSYAILANVRYAVVVIAFAVVWAALRVPSGHAADCTGLMQQLTAIDAKIAQIENGGEYGKPGEPLKPPKYPLDPQELAQLKALQAQRDTVQAQLALCERPPTPPLSFPAVRATGIGVPDPQIAVGRSFVAAIDTSDVVFYDKKTLQPVPAASASGLPSNPVRTTALFKTFFPTIDASMKLPANVCDPSKPTFNSGFDRKHPNVIIPGCIKEAYDTRVVYDAPRHRFWIEAAIRNPLWPCKGKPGATTTVQSDPNPSAPKKAICHATWKASWAHRFIAIAVSDVDANGNEDLSKPFHRYVLVDDYADWPLVSVHGPFLVLTHKAAGDVVEVFDAAKLAAGEQAETSMVVKPLATFAGSVFGAGGVLPASAIFPVNVHGASSDPSYVVSVNGNELLVSGIGRTKSGAPFVVQGARVTLTNPLSGLRHPPVFRNGKLYAAGFTCVTAKPCTRYDARILRVPVHMNASGGAVVASANTGAGFMYALVAAPNADTSYELPAVDAGAAGDMVVVFQRGSPDPKHRIPFSARYSTFYHDKQTISTSGLLKAGTAPAPGSSPPPDPAGSGVVDLGGVAVDPSDDRTIWVSHAFWNGTKYDEVFGAVKP
jgi:hypothetical protein